jgi:hypothetical protein
MSILSISNIAFMTRLVFNPSRYVLNGRGHVVNKTGEIVQTAIKPGTRVRVYYANMGDLRMIDHVVVVD